MNKENDSKQPEITANVSKIPDRIWYFALALDVAVWVSMLWRNYDKAVQWNWTVAHYYLFYPISDSMIFWLAPNKRRWWIPFRLLQGMQIGLLNGTLVVVGVEEAFAAITLVRYVLIVIYIGHSMWLFKSYGPTSKNAEALLSYWKRRTVKPWPFVGVCMAHIFGPYLIYSTHSNFGKDAMDGAMIANSAGNAVTLYVKMIIFDILIADHWKRGMAFSIMTLLFSVQWIFIWEVFWKAPLCLMHVGSELTFLSTAILYFIVYYKTKKNDNINVINSTEIENEIQHFIK